MKSALELAMEKADAGGGDDRIQLSDEQKAAIEETRKQYEAKWAEQEIVLQGRLQKLTEETDPQTLAEHQSQLQGEIKRVRDGIFEERDAKIEEIRAQ